MDPVTAALNFATQLIAANMKLYDNADAATKARLSDVLIGQVTDALLLVTDIFHAFKPK